MNANQPLFRLASSLVLAATACEETFQLWGTMFALGEAGGPTSFLDSLLLLITALGILGLAIAALGALTGKKAFARVGLVSCFFVLPMAVLFSWGALHADILNSRIPPNRFMQIHTSLMQWTVDGVAVPLALVSMLVCWLRIRRSPTEARPNVARVSLSE
jgi:hypothetical protein